MLFWRISRHPDLGGLRVSGRRHDAGQPLVYFAESPAATLLEVCVHAAANDIPPDFTLLRIEGPDIALPDIPSATLPKDWTTRPEVTRELGTDWLRQNHAVLLRIPSAIVPHTSNFLQSPPPRYPSLPHHPSPHLPFDPRLKQ